MGGQLDSWPHKIFSVYVPNQEINTAGTYPHFLEQEPPNLQKRAASGGKKMPPATDDVPLLEGIWNAIMDKLVSHLNNQIPEEIVADDKGVFKVPHWSNPGIFSRLCCKDFLIPKCASTRNFNKSNQ